MLRQELAELGREVLAELPQLAAIHYSAWLAIADSFAVDVPDLFADLQSDFLRLAADLQGLPLGNDRATPAASARGPDDHRVLSPIMHGFADLRSRLEQVVERPGTPTEQLRQATQYLSGRPGPTDQPITDDVTPPELLTSADLQLDDELWLPGRSSRSAQQVTEPYDQVQEPAMPRSQMTLRSLALGLTPPANPVSADGSQNPLADDVDIDELPARQASRDVPEGQHVQGFGALADALCHSITRAATVRSETDVDGQSTSQLVGRQEDFSVQHDHTERQAQRTIMPFISAQASQKSPQTFVDHPTGETELKPSPAPPEFANPNSSLSRGALPTEKGNRLGPLHREPFDSVSRQSPSQWAADIEDHTPLHSLSLTEPDEIAAVEQTGLYIVSEPYFVRRRAERQYIQQLLRQVSADFKRFYGNR